MLILDLSYSLFTKGSGDQQRSKIRAANPEYFAFWQHENKDIRSSRAETLDIPPQATVDSGGCYYTAGEDNITVRTTARTSKI